MTYIGNFSDVEKEFNLLKARIAELEGNRDSEEPKNKETKEALLPNPFKRGDTVEIVEKIFGLGEGDSYMSVVTGIEGNDTVYLLIEDLNVTFKFKREGNRGWCDQLLGPGLEDSDLDCDYHLIKDGIRIERLEESLRKMNNYKIGQEVGVTKTCKGVFVNYYGADVSFISKFSIHVTLDGGTIPIEFDFKTGDTLIKGRRKGDEGCEFILDEED
jgi:hypothetical protein